MEDSFKMLAKQVGKNKVIGADSPCEGGKCPIICKRSDGKLIVVGKKLSQAETEAFLKSDLAVIYDDEYPVMIEPELLSTANNYL